MEVVFPLVSTRIHSDQYNFGINLAWHVMQTTEPVAVVAVVVHAVSILKDANRKKNSNKNTVNQSNTKHQKRHQTHFYMLNSSSITIGIDTLSTITVHSVLNDYFRV